MASLPDETPPMGECVTSRRGDANGRMASLPDETPSVGDSAERTERLCYGEAVVVSPFLGESLLRRDAV